MPRFIALLRGINVSGHRLIPMAALKTALTTHGFTDVVTYLQSGNVLFTAKPARPVALASAIQQLIAKKFGHPDVHIVIKTPADFARLVSENPFAALAAAPGFDPKTLHVVFLSTPLPTPAAFAKLKLPARPSESVRLIDDVIYLHCPEGYGQTKLANPWFEKALGCPCTTRNWNTISALTA